MELSLAQQGYIQIQMVKFDSINLPWTFLLAKKTGKKKGLVFRKGGIDDAEIIQVYKLWLIVCKLFNVGSFFVLADVGSWQVTHLYCCV